MSSPIALITGGSSGIGLAVSEKLLDRGYQVYSVSRNPARGTKNRYFSPLELDLCNIEKVGSFCDSFLEEYGVPDLLINNAGSGAFYEWSTFPDEEIISQINLLFTSAIVICRKFAPRMQVENKGIILNLSSLATLYPLPYMPLYNAGKSALSSFTESMVLEHTNYPKFIDFRMGDVRTNFNQVASMQSPQTHSPKMMRAWQVIEWQLDKSPTPKVAAVQILKAIDRNRHGRFYGGGFFHRHILPQVRRLLATSMLCFFLKAYYQLTK